MKQFRIANTEISDLNTIYKLFEESIVYQEKHGYPVWKNYDKGAIIRDIENRHQYKLLHDNTIALIFGVAYSDKVIWRDKDQGDAIYLHRIVVNPSFKGQRLFGHVVEWSIGHIKEKKLKSIRMDTWSANPNIIEYYKSFGFIFVENFTTPDTPTLPEHNRKLGLTLLEYAGTNTNPPVP